VDYTLVSRGTEPVWMPQGPGGQGAPPQTYKIENVPVWLKYDVTRTVPRPRGYIIPASIAKVVPLLLDHGIQVHRFTEPGDGARGVRGGRGPAATSISRGTT
jgi:hypothetical protein